jgi:hypothetical protein
MKCRRENKDFSKEVLRMVDIQTVSIAIASASVIAGVIYYAFQIKNQTKTRQTDLIMRLYSTFGGKEFQDAWTRIRAIKFKDYDEYVKKCGEGDYVQCATFFEGIGVLLQKKLIDINLVDTLFSVPLKLMYERMKPIIEANRMQFHDQRVFGYFEDLYNEMKKREQKLQSKIKADG